MKRKITRGQASRKAGFARRQRDLEALEQRVLFATFVWDGGGGNNNWTTAANWVGNVAPATDGSDSIEFPATAARKSNTNNFPAGSLFENIFFSGSGYTLSGNDLVLNDDIISTAGGSGTNTIALNVTMTEGTTPVSGFRSEGATLLISGNVNTETGNTLRLQGVSTVRVTGVISGTGDLSKRGSGTSTITADNTYTSNSTVDAGSSLTLDHTGSGSVTGTGNVFVDGDLRGAGRFTGSLNVRAGGDLFPGVGSNSTGILNTGSLSIASTGRYGVNVTSTTAGSGYDQVNVTGSVSLSAGAVLQVTPGAGFTPAEGDQFTIIGNDGSDAVSGTFDGLAEGGILSAGGNSYQISYVGGDGNDVVLTVVVANDPPVNSVPGTQSTPEDTALVFSTANNNLISISDPDAATSDVQVTLAATNGTLTLSGTTGLAFTTGTGTGDSTMTFTGTIESINTALAGLTFTPTTSFTGAASVSITTNDLGATGPGGAQQDVDSIAITVVDASAVAPVATADVASRNIGQSVEINVLNNDSDPLSRPLSLSITAQPASGTATVNDNGTPSDPSDDTITYTPNGGFNGDDTFTYRITTDQFTTATATVTVSVNAGAALDADPDDPTKTALFIVGTDASEKFAIKKKKTQLLVTINKVQQGELLSFPTGSVIIIAKGGNDTLAAGAAKNNTARFYGGDGNDKISGTKFNDILIGGTGDDKISGSRGNDLLIGGGGLDKITGSSGDDILISGPTDYNDYTFSNVASLRDIFAVWNNGSAYADRVTAITTAPGVGTTGAAFTADILDDDTSVDKLNGGGNDDLYIANTVAGSAIEKIKKTASETLIELN